MSLWFVVWNLAHSSNISNHSFFISSMGKVAPKTTVKCKFVIFLSSFSVLVSLICEAAYIANCVPENEQPTFAGCWSGSSCWLSIKYWLIMTPRPVVWVAHWVLFQFVIFVIGYILWLYQTQGLFIICAPVTDVTKYSLCERTLQWVSKKLPSYIY